MQFTLLQHGEDINRDHGAQFILRDDIWKRWYNEVMRRHREGGKTYDVDECQECGVIGIEHLTECLNFLTITSSE